MDSVLRSQRWAMIRTAQEAKALGWSTQWVAKEERHGGQDGGETAQREIGTGCFPASFPSVQRSLSLEV